MLYGGRFVIIVDENPIGRLQLRLGDGQVIEVDARPNFGWGWGSRQVGHWRTSGPLGRPEAIIALWTGPVVGLQSGQAGTYTRR